MIVCVLLQQLVLQHLRRSSEESEGSLCVAPAANTTSHKIPAGWRQAFTEDVPVLAGARILWNNLWESLL